METKVTSIRLTKYEEEELNRIIKEIGTTKTRFIRSAILEKIQRIDLLKEK